MGRYNEAAFDNYNNKALEPCSGCGRTFNPDALIKHQRYCLKGRDEEGKSPPKKSPTKPPVRPRRADPAPEE